MKTHLVVVALLLLMIGAPVWAGDPKGDAIANALFKASGGENWRNVKRIQFTFNVEQDGKQILSAKHDWNVLAETDTVQWAGKTAVARLNRAAADGESKEAFERWTNDSYWLLAPIKVLDPGVTVTAAPATVPGADEFDVIQLKFGSVGLTPEDVYNLYVDRETHLLRRWDYMPAPGKMVRGTWEGYQDFGGLKLSTEHQFGDKRITFTDIKVETK
jgi:hypothetical protein